MIVSVRCRCGRRFRAAPAADGTVECPTCDRITVARPRTGRRARWLALSAGIAVVVLLGGVLAATVRHRNPHTEAAARGDEPAARRSTPPAVKPPVVTTPDKPGTDSAPDSTPDRPPAPPAPDVVPPPPAPVAPAPPRRAGELRPAGRYTVGSTAGQEVVFSRRSAFRVAGADLTQGSRYALTSSLAVTGVNADGSFVVEQTILAARLIDADPGVRAPLAAALEGAKGSRFGMTVGPGGGVTAFRGVKDSISVLPGKDAGLGDSLRVWSLLDADAWKELAGLTFFQPDRPPAEGVTWERAAAHDWGPLGSWRGTTTYAVGRPAGAAARIDYTHDLDYRPPAPGADRDLPVRVSKSDFKTVAAGGVIVYDPASGRVTAGEETFRVRGAVLVSVGGIEAAVEMEERQEFKLTVTDLGVRELVRP